MQQQGKKHITRRKRTKAGRYVSDIRAEDLHALFGMPAQQAAVQCGVSFTVFKKLCRKFNIERWPYRRLKAIGLASAGPFAAGPPGASPPQQPAAGGQESAMEEEGEEEDRQASEACASRAAEGATDSPSAATGMHRLASDGRHSGGGAGEMLCRAAALCCCFEQAQQQQQQQGQQAGDAPAPVSPAAAPRCSPLLATSLDPPGAGGSHGELSPQAAHPGQSTRDHKLQHMLDALCKQLETPATAHESEILVRLRQAVASRKEQQQQGSPRLPPFPQPGLLPAAGPARQQPQQQPPQQQQGSPQLPAFLQSVSMPPPAPTPQPVLGRLPLAGGAQVYPSAGEPSHLLGALVGLATQHGCPSAFAPFHHPHADEEQPRCTKMAATVPRISQPIRPTPSLVLPLSVIQLACAPRPQTQLPPSLAAARLDLLRQRLSPAMR